MSTATNLVHKKCVPCEGGIPPLGADERKRLLREIPGWEIVRDHHLSANFKFPNFVTALDLVNKVGALAEAEGHHPNIFLTWGKVGLEIWTHAIDNLTENDFVLAAKINAIPR